MIATTPQPIVQVDAFAERPFTGNPAGVCLLERVRDAEWMQAVAREMNLAETAFVVPREDGEWDLRWFTPAVEVDLCGHATLATAHVLWEDGRLAPDTEARFQSRSGRLTARRTGDLIELDFPAEPADEVPAFEGLTAMVGAEPQWVGRNRLDFLVQLADEATVRGLRPDLGRIEQLPARGLIVTARSDGGDYDFVSRFFAPQAGVPEDPVTGSAHCALSPFWSARLGRDTLVGFQASKRGGRVHVRHAGERVMLGGQAVTVLRGELLA